MYADTPSTTTTLLLQRTRDLQRQAQDELTQVRLQHTQHELVAQTAQQKLVQENEEVFFYCVLF